MSPESHEGLEPRSFQLASESCKAVRHSHRRPPAAEPVQATQAELAANARYVGETEPSRN